MNGRLSLHPDTIVEGLYSHLAAEIAAQSYSDDELVLLNDDLYYYGRFLKPASRQYALRVVDDNLPTALTHFGLSNGRPPDILDLGCGLGMQSIMFALLGAHVTAIDIKKPCITLCKKRKVYYEELYERELDIDFLECDFRKLEQNETDQRYDCLFSMSAFSHIVPLADTVTTSSWILRGSARVFIWDINPSYLWLNRLTRAMDHLPEPQAVAEEFRGHGFETDFLTGGCAVPFPFWGAGVRHRVAASVNDRLRRSIHLSYNFVFGATRSAGAS